MRLGAAEYSAIIRAKINGGKGRDKFKTDGGKRRGKFQSCIWQAGPLSASRNFTAVGRKDW